MKITLHQFGGLAATLRRPPLVVDSSHLDSTDAGRLSRLVERARGEGSTRCDAGPDQVSYRMTIEDGGPATALARHDGDMTPSYDALLRFVRDKA